MKIERKSIERLVPMPLILNFGNLTEIIFQKRNKIGRNILGYNFLVAKVYLHGICFGNRFLIPMGIQFLPCTDFCY